MSLTEDDPMKIRAMTLACVVCVAPVAHAGQQPTQMQMQQLIATLQQMQRNAEYEQFRQRQLQRRQVWQQFGQQLQDFGQQLEMQSQIRRQTTALEAIAQAQQRAAQPAVPVAPVATPPRQYETSEQFTARVDATPAREPSRQYMSDADRKAWDEFWAEWDAADKATKSKGKACPFWRKSCWSK